MTPAEANSSPQKVVLISGATGGFGRETALLLARRGYRIFAGYRNESKGNQLLEEARKEDLPLSLVPLDITTPHGPLEAVKHVLKRAGRLDVLINNAGYGLAGPVEELEIEEIEAQFNTNVYGQLRLTKAAIPAMRKQRSGTLIFLSSIAGQFGFPFFSAYSASKHAIEAFGEALRHELQVFGIFSVLVEPGMFKTGFVQTNLAIGKNTLRPDSPYYEMGKAARDKYFKKDDAAPPARIVAEKILEILGKARPKLRYQVGTDSFLMIRLKKLLPSAWTEYFVRKNYEPKDLK